MMTFMVPFSQDDVEVIAGLSCQDSLEIPFGPGFPGGECSPVATDGPCGSCGPCGRNVTCGLGG